MSDRKTRTVVFRLTEKECDRLDELVDKMNRSQAQGYPVSRSTLLKVLVRNAVDLGPDFLKHELNKLEDNSRSLLGIGRNLNQLVKRIYTGEAQVNIEPEALQEIIDYIKASREQIVAIVRRNYQRKHTKFHDPLKKSA